MNQECGRDKDYFHEGTIIEFIANKKISYTWEELYEPHFPRTVVTWELEKIGNKKTSLKLQHTGFTANEKAKQYDEGWSHFLNELVNIVRKQNKTTTITSLFLIQGNEIKTDRL